MQRNELITIIIVGLMALLAFSILFPPIRFFPAPPDRPRLEELGPEQLLEMSNLLALYIKGKSIIGLINVALLLYLVINHIELYQNTKSNFSLSLILFSLALLLYSLSTNPILTWITGFQSRSILQAFNFLPDIFTTLASIILVYISRQ